MRVIASLERLPAQPKWEMSVKWTADADRILARVAKVCKRINDS